MVIPPRHIELTSVGLEITHPNSTYVYLYFINLGTFFPESCNIQYLMVIDVLLKNSLYHSTTHSANTDGVTCKCLSS